ncbi:MAG: Fe-S cluster assembly protein SufD [Woeseiaceae bacterium]|nr:Fe-S cluster assembly protein SufD [Woeseiaceae bacterium]
MKDVSFALDALESEVASLSGDSLAPVRKAALERFKVHGFPTTRDEDWKYTDLSPVVALGNRWLGEQKNYGAEPDLALVDEIKSSIDATWLVIANGELLEAQSSNLDLDGISISESSHSDIKTSSPNSLSDLNLALLGRGVTINVSPRADTTRPIALLIIDSTGSGTGMSQTRVDIKVEAGCKARFVEYHVSSGDGEHYANVHINVEIARDATVDYLRYQQRSILHSQTARLDVVLRENAALHHSGIDLGGKLIRNDLQIDINGKHSSARFDGVYIAAGQQHIDNHTRVDHRVGPAISRQEYRGVASGRSRAVWNGKAIVHKGADGTDAEQANHNLLLSDKAEIDAKPELEIYADEVKCAHGTTVGQLDEKALFYLRTRGIERVRAERILTRAFATRIVNQSPLPELHEWIGGKVEQRLRQIAEGDSE